MKSPFPGMDPYLERHWLDVHARLVTYTADALNDQLPSSLVASTEERITIGGDRFDDILTAGPDVRVAESGGPQRTAVVDYQAPLKLVVELDPPTEHFIRIIEAQGERLIAVIEFISPSNKLGGIAQFRKRREEFIMAGVHVVEIDLVRRGNWRALLRPQRCPDTRISEYRITVRIGGDPLYAYLYPAPLRQPLPSIVIPLRQGDPEVKLDLQTLVDMVYVRGRYATRLNYREPLDPPLESADMQWAEQLLPR